jgi:hypothetical protein
VSSPASNPTRIELAKVRLDLVEGQIVEAAALADVLHMAVAGLIERVASNAIGGAVELEHPWTLEAR